MSCKNCGQHTEFRQTFCCESCALSDHERAHPEPEAYQGECDLCQEKAEASEREWKKLQEIVDADIEYQKREGTHGAI